MYKRQVYSSNESCILHTSISDLTKKLDSDKAKNFVDKKIPDGKIVYPMYSKEKPNIEIENDKKYSINEEFPYFSVRGSNIDYKDILAFSEYILERKRQEKGIYNLHSSTVGKGDSCFIIHGASKSGKTMISLNSDLRKNLEFLVNERSLIDMENKKMVGGCKLLDIEDYHKNSFPELNGKEELRLDEINSGYKIKGIIYPSIDNGQKEAIIEKKDSFSSEWMLYPEFTARVRGANKRMFDFSYPLDSLDTKELARKRTDDLRKFLKEVPLYFVKGSIDDISDFIKNQL